MTTNDWLVLTGVLTALFTGIAIVQRIFERPRPHFSVFLTDIDPIREDTVNCFVWAINDGDAPALDCNLTSPKGEPGWVSMEDKGRSGSLPPNQLLKFTAEATVPGVRNDGPNVDGVLPTFDGPLPEGDEYVEITWHQSPYRAIRHHKRYKLCELPKRPIYGELP